MEQEIIRYAATQGIFAILFIWLLFYVLKNNEKREAELRRTIDNLVSKLDILEDMKECISSIKDELKALKGKILCRDERQ